MPSNRHFYLTIYFRNNCLRQEVENYIDFERNRNIESMSPEEYRELVRK